jgi:hypothetical protein
LKNHGAAVDDVIVCRRIYSTVHLRYNHNLVNWLILVIVGFGISTDLSNAVTRKLRAGHVKGKEDKDIPVTGRGCT